VVSFSSRQVKKISKYFTQVSKKENEGRAGSESSGDLSNSPYKNCLNSAQSLKLNDSASDLDDFKTPKAINKVSKIVQLKPPPNNVKKRKKAKNCNVPLKKFVEDNFKHVDVNPDHLQMALALSESSYRAENPDDQPSSQEKRESFRQAFEKYGFGYSKNKVSVERKRSYEINKKSKTSRYRFVTPILNMRTTEEREALISSKVTLILAQNDRIAPKTYSHERTELFCESLKNHHVSATLFKLNQMELEDLNESGRFYVAGLGIEACRAKCGSLLKDWRKIAGRERSPTRLDDITEVSPQTTKSSHVDLTETPPACGETPKITSPCLLTKETDECEHLTVDESNSDSLLQDSFKETNDCVYLTNRDEELVSSESLQLGRGDFTADSGSTNENSPHSRNNVEVVSPGPTEIFKVNSPHKSFQFSFTAESCKTAENSPLNCNEIDIVSPGPEKNFKINSPRKSFQLSCGDFIQIETSPKFDENPGIVSKETTSSPHRSVSPDLFGSDDDYHQEEAKTSVSPHSFPGLEKGINPEELECFDLTQSDQEEGEKNTSVTLSDPEKTIVHSLNITEYVNNLLYENNEAAPSQKFERISMSGDDQSQESIYISDDELNYSSVFSTPPFKKKVEYDISDGDADDDYLANLEVSLEERIKAKMKKIPSPQKFSSETDKISEDYVDLASSNISRGHSNLDDNSPALEGSFLNQVPRVETPNESSGNSFVIKTTNVTPMADYDKMDTPKIVKELDKFGLKPIKRQKGVKLLKFIYESTHPLVEDDDGKVVKKRRTQPLQSGDIIVGEIGGEEDLIFERTQSKRTASCRVPLHIVWHNFVMSNPKIRENILLYEPLQLEVLHSMLKDQGFKFNIQVSLSVFGGFCGNLATFQDLLAFLDRKCVTIRTAQGQHRGKKHK
jgi:hypothetical protein